MAAQETRKPVKPSKVCDLPHRFAFGTPGARNLGTGKTCVRLAGDSVTQARPQHLGSDRVAQASWGGLAPTLVLVGLLD